MKQKSIRTTSNILQAPFLLIEWKAQDAYICTKIRCNTKFLLFFPHIWIELQQFNTSSFRHVLNCCITLKMTKGKSCFLTPFPSLSLTKIMSKLSKFMIWWLKTSNTATDTTTTTFSSWGTTCCCCCMKTSKIYDY